MTTRPHPTTSEMVNQFSQEPNYSDPNADDFESLSRDRVPVRSMSADDLDAIVRIDKHVTSRDRRAYYERLVGEAIEESGIRVSLVAELDGEVVGFVAARVDYGEFGLASTAAVIETIGVDPAHSGKSVGKALISQLLNNLASLRVESVRTEVMWNEFGLLGFLERCGFEPSQRLVFTQPL